MAINGKRQTITYENMSLFVSDKTGFSNFANSASGVNLIPSLQSLSFGFDTPSSRVETIGTKKYFNHSFLRGAEVNIDLQTNEDFSTLFNQILTSSGISEETEDDRNFYAIIGKQKYNDVFNDNLSGSEVLSFGNCQLVDYGLSQSINDFAKSSYSFVGSNMEVQTLDQVGEIFSGRSPALNLTGDQTNLISGFFEVPFTVSGISNYYNKSKVNKNLFPSHRTTISISGSNISNFIIETDIFQSFNLNFPINLKSIYTIGKAHPIKRKILYPSRGNISFENIVSSFVTGFDPYNFREGDKNLDKFLDENETFAISIDLFNLENENVSIDIVDAKLDSQSYGMGLGNNNLTASLDYSFDISNVSVKTKMILSKDGSFLKTKDGFFLEYI